jgi:hypothetical protein
MNPPACPSLIILGNMPLAFNFFSRILEYEDTIFYICAIYGIYSLRAFSSISPVEIMAKVKKSRKNKLRQQAAPPQRPYLIIIPALIITVYIFIHLALKLNFIQDDAYISFRYVKNFIAGNGLVFNPGERVEGYTNFLWVMLLSLTSLVNFNIETAAQSMSIAFGALNLVIVFFIARLLISAIPGLKLNNALKTLLSLLPVFMLSLNESYAFWCVSGMETSMFIFFTLSSVWLFLLPDFSYKKNILTPLCLLGAALTRPEGILLFVWIYFYRLFFTLRGVSIKEAPGKIKPLLPQIAFFAVPYLVYIAFRLIYYGKLFPNTFYAKTGFSWQYAAAGAGYYYQFLKSSLLYGIILLLPSYLLKLKYLRPQLLFLYGFICLYSVYVILVGGDVLSLNRFLLPLLPIFLVLWSCFVFVFSQNSKSRFNLTAGIMITASAAFSVINYQQQHSEVLRINTLEKDLVQKMQIQAQWFAALQQSLGRPIKTALTTIGAFSYFSGTVVIDMLGLTDEYIAHNPVENADISADSTIAWKERHYNAKYILARRPDYILFSTGQKPSAFAERALFAEKEFFINYYAQYVYIPEIKSGWVIYTRRPAGSPAVWTGSTDNPDYSARFIAHYVNALNLLTKFYTSKDEDTFARIIDEAGKTIKAAPCYFADIYRVIGEAFAIKREYKNAERNFLRALQADESNSLASLGLARIYEMNKSPLAKQYTELALKYSPHILE